MREIVFRGKRTDNGEWVEGYLVKHNERCYIYHEEPDEMCQTGNWLFYNEVIPETVGQYTGLTDKNGKMIFEGDILKGSLPDYAIEPDRIGVVQWGMYGWIVKFNSPEWKMARVGFGSFGDYEVIGNLYDNTNKFHCLKSVE